MFINPKHALEKGWVKFPEWMSPEQQQQCIQPNAIDFTIDHMQAIGPTTCQITNTSKKMRSLSDVPLEGGMWKLPGGAYDFMSDFYVDLPVGVAALVIARSTFVRNGMFITTGLWDSGFRGNAGGVLHVMTGMTEIEQHVRVGQLILVRSDAAGAYSGGYNTNPGEHWTTTLKN